MIDWKIYSPATFTELITDSEIYGGIEYHYELCPSGDYTIGNTNSAYCIFKSSHQLAVGTEFRIQNNLLINNMIVKSIEIENQGGLNLYRYTCYDKMSLFDTDITYEFNAYMDNSRTLNQLYTALRGWLGIHYGNYYNGTEWGTRALGTITLPNSDYVIPAQPTIQNLTARQLLKWIGTMAGCNFYFGGKKTAYNSWTYESGLFAFSDFNSSTIIRPSLSLTPSNAKKIKIYDYTCPSINGAEITSNGDGISIGYATAGQDPVTLYLEYNQLMDTSTAGDLLSTIVMNASSFCYKPSTVSLFLNEINATDGEEIESYITYKYADGDVYRTNPALRIDFTSSGIALDSYIPSERTDNKSTDSSTLLSTGILSGNGTESFSINATNGDITVSDMTVNGSSLVSQLADKASVNHGHAVASQQYDGFMSSVDKTKLDNFIGRGSDTQPIYLDSNGYPQAISYTIEKSVPSNAKFTDTTYSVATTAANGLMSSSDKSKLNNIILSFDLSTSASRGLTFGTRTRALIIVDGNEASQKGMYIAFLGTGNTPTIASVYEPSNKAYTITCTSTKQIVVNNTSSSNKLYVSVIQLGGVEVE